MTACPRCSFDAATPAAASWSFAIGAKLPNLNDHRQNDGAGFKYRKLRDQWTAVLKGRAPRASSQQDFRRVSIVRVFSGREQRWDYDNLVGGAKLVVDAMVRAGLLVDDSEKWAQVAYRQERGDRTEVQFTIESLSPATTTMEATR